VPYLALVFAIAWLAANAVATRTLLSVEYTREQRLAQLVLVWLVPFLGALVVVAFARRGHHESPPELVDFDDSEDVDVSPHEER
jgi:hypothetical protein